MAPAKVELNPILHHHSRLEIGLQQKKLFFCWLVENKGTPQEATKKRGANSGEAFEGVCFGQPASSFSGSAPDSLALLRPVWAIVQDYLAGTKRG